MQGCARKHVVAPSITRKPRNHKHLKILIDVRDYAWLQTLMVQRSFKVPRFCNAPLTNKTKKLTRIICQKKKKKEIVANKKRTPRLKVYTPIGQGNIVTKACKHRVHTS